MNPIIQIFKEDKRDCKNINYCVLIKGATYNNTGNYYYDFSTLLKNDNRIMKKEKDLFTLGHLRFLEGLTSLRNIPLLTVGTE